MMTRNVNGAVVILSAEEEAAVLADQAAQQTVLTQIQQQRDAENALDAAFASDANRADLISHIQSAIPMQIFNFVQSNVTDLPSARSLLAKVILLVARTIKT